jgi:peroxiredoxin
MNHFILLAVFLPAFFAGPLRAAPVQVGDRVPDTTLRDERGVSHKLAEVLGGKPSVLVFYRGGWCPYCNRHLAALAGVEKDLLAAGYQILAISPDQPTKLAETPDRAKLGYRLYSDSSMDAGKAFGIAFEMPADLVAKYKNEYKIDLEAAAGQTHHLLPHPAVYVVDSSGVIRFAHVNEDYKVRLDPEKIVEAAKRAAR